MLCRFPGGESAIYDGPSLFVRAERSAYVKEEHYSTIAEIFPNSEIKTIEGAGVYVCQRVLLLVVLKGKVLTQS